MSEMPQPYQLDPEGHTGLMAPDRPWERMGPFSQFGYGIKHALQQPFRALAQRSGMTPQSEVDRAAYNEAPYLHQPWASAGDAVGNLGAGAVEAYLAARGLKGGVGAMRASPEMARMGSQLPRAVQSPLAAVGRVAAGESKLSPYAGGAALGYAGSKQAPYTSGEDDTNRTMLSTALGTVAPLPFQAARRFVSPMFPNAARHAWEAPVQPSGYGPEVEAWANRGKDITGQYLPPYAYAPEGKTTTEQVLGLMPGTTSCEEVAHHAQQKFTNAVGGMIGATPDASGRVSLTTAVPAKTQEVGDAIGAIRDKYGVTAKVNTGPLKKPLNAVSSDVRAQAGDAGIPAVRAIDKQLQGHYSDIMGLQGGMTGAEYTAKRTALYDLADRSEREGFAPGIEASRKMRDALDDAFRRTISDNGTPEDIASHTFLNKQYSVLKLLREGPGKEIYDTQTGLIEPDALHKAAVKRGETCITGQQDMPSGNPDPRVDVTNLGTSPGYQTITSDLKASHQPGGHGIMGAISGGIPALAVGLPAYELASHDKDVDAPEALAIAGAAATGGYGLGRTAGNLMRSPVMTEGLARHFLGSHGAAPLEWAGALSGEGMPYQVPHWLHNMAAENGPPAQAPAQQSAPATPDIQWELAPPEGASSHP